MTRKTDLKKEIEDITKTIIKLEKEKRMRINELHYLINPHLKGEEEL